MKEKAASFEPETDTDSKWFVLKHAFNTKSGTEYGYYFSADNFYLKYNSDEHMYTGRDAYCARGNGADYPDGWYYSMYICENWYYYEFHFGNAGDYQDQYVYRNSENPPPPGNYFVLNTCFPAAGTANETHNKREGNCAFPFSRQHIKTVSTPPQKQITKSPNNI